MKKLILYFILLFSGPAAFAQSDVYMFCYFKGNGEDGLHYAYSEDGFKWKSLRGDSSFLKPTAGKDKLMRDPCITQGPDGTFHMVWTVSWHEKTIGYASSKDLLNWSEQQNVPVMEHENAKNCWAPEITYDTQRKQFMIYWATTIPGRFPATDSLGDNNHRMYYVTTKDFKTYSETKLLYDQGFNVIDASIVPDGKRYLMFLKDETLRPQPQKKLYLVTSKKLTGGYGKPVTPITGNYWAEGPTAIKIGNTWVVYFDKYTQHKYGAITSTDLLNWKDESDRLELPKGLRHGTVFKVKRTVLEKLL
jgi:hypothetical protein